MRLIDAGALMEIYMDRLSLVADRYSPDSSECGILAGAMKLLDEQPTIEPERKKGERITKSTNGEIFDCCSICGYVEWDEPKNFCPACGADMRGEQP